MGLVKAVCLWLLVFAAPAALRFAQAGGGDEKPGSGLRVAFFETSVGNQPARDWLNALALDDRKLLGHDIRLVQDGWPMGMPLVRKMDADLWELRSSLSERIGRVFFTVRRGRLVLLHGFIKKSRKTPRQDLAMAKLRLSQLRNV